MYLDVYIKRSLKQNNYSEQDYKGLLYQAKKLGIEAGKVAVKPKTEAKEFCSHLLTRCPRNNVLRFRITSWFYKGFRQGAASRGM